MSRSPASPIPLFKIKVEEKGRIKDIKKVVVRIQGLPTCLNGQIVRMGDVKGIIMGYDEEDVLALVLGDESKLRMGGEVSGVSEPFKIPVGDGFVGRMVTALGTVCDDGPRVEPDTDLPVLRESPPIISRAQVDEFLHTGTKVTDIVVPIAKGQRQLILGDRMTGKTVIALDAVINQKRHDTICIYCCVGKSVSAIEKVVTTLQDSGSLDYTTVVVAADSAPVGEQYLVPFSAATMAEYHASKGKDVLVVFDDLTKHAWAYRQIALLLERPPGREAYPGDIFYVQTQLMERAGRFSKDHGGGSITFLGIAETLQGDLTGYIPSNLSSMCDGQICMSSQLFAEGCRPAVDFGLSLSIIGGRCQPPILKKLGGTLRADYARYLEVVNLSRLQSGLSDEAQAVVDKGSSIMAAMQQLQFNPVSLAEEVLLLYAVNKGLLVKMSERERRSFRESVYTFAADRHRTLLDQIEASQEYSTAIESGLEELMAEYLAENPAANS